MSRIKVAAAAFVALGAAGIAARSFGGASAGASPPVPPAAVRALARDVLQHLGVSTFDEGVYLPLDEGSERAVTAEP